MTLTELFTNIADAIRTKKGTSDKIVASDFATEIENLPSGGGDIEDYYIDSLSNGNQANPTYSSGINKSIKKIPMMSITGTSCSNMFMNCISLETIPLLNTSNVTSFNRMFYGCENLKTISKIDTSKGTYFNSMFEGCKSLTEVPDLDTSSGLNFTRMFFGCENLTEIPKINISKTTSLSYIFCKCKKITKIPNFDTSNITNFSGMFSGCENLTEVPDLDTSSGTNFSEMFYDSNNKQTNKLTTIPELNTSNGTNFYRMFYFRYNLHTIPKLDTSKATNIQNIMNLCRNLKNIGGFENLGKAYTQKTSNYSDYTLNLNETSSSGSITYDSLMNVINNLYDLNLTYDVANGGTLYTQKLILGTTYTAKLTADEIAIATAKRMVC